MPILIATRGPKSGECNVCGDIGPLTEDHTPPKGCLKPKQVVLQHISHHLSDGGNHTKGRISQNGVKYRTLCHRCNNMLLGANYDPPFISFVNSVGSLLTSSLYLPNTLAVPGQPQAIMRSLLGHMSAQGVGRYQKGPLTGGIRDFMLDTSTPLPAGVNAFYWAYPYRPHVMVRDAAFIDHASQESVVIWLLKFFPMAFMFTWGPPVGLNEPMQSFEPWRNSPFDLVTDLQVTLRPTLHPYWPEAPSKQSTLVYGQEAVCAGLQL